MAAILAAHQVAGAINAYLANWGDNSSYHQARGVKLEHLLGSSIWLARLEPHQPRRIGIKVLPFVVENGQVRLADYLSYDKDELYPDISATPITGQEGGEA